MGNFAAAIKNYSISITSALKKLASTTIGTWPANSLVTRWAPGAISTKWRFCCPMFMDSPDCGLADAQTRGKDSCEKPNCHLPGKLSGVTAH